MSVNFDQFNSIVSLFHHQVRLFQDKPYLWKKIDGKYTSLSWKQVHEQVDSIAKGLKNLGILKGDRVVILSENRPEWQIADLAIMSIGAISVPAYTTSTTSDYRHIINHSEARCIIISSHSLALKALPAVVKSSKCKNVIKIDNDKNNYNEPVNITSWNTLIKENNDDKLIDFEEEAKTQQRKDTACIIYTSGTGGHPKGVMLSHGAMLTNCTGAKELLKNLIKDLKEIRFLSWLPLSHSYEHTLQFFKMGISSQIFYAESIDTLLVNMGEVKPHFMTAVPRFYDSLHTRISQGLKKQGKISQLLFSLILIISSACCTKERAIQSTPISRALFKSDLSLDVKELIGRITSGIFTPFLFETIPLFRISVIKKSFPCSIICRRILPSFISKIVFGVKFSYISG